jgi:5-methyltetrahydropteroyltriglutamate--homocysteine methyltransferase
MLQVPEVQVLEPALCLFDAGTFRSLYESTYATLSKVVPINLVTFYDDVGECFGWVSKLPVKAVSFDFCGVVRTAFDLTCWN